MRLATLGVIAITVAARVQAGKGVADTNGTVRDFWDTQSVIGAEVRSAILERCGCNSVVDHSSTGADHDR